MSTFYSIALALWRFCEWNGVRELVLHRERVPAEGPFILAVTHLSHLEPAIVSARVVPQIRWMARHEYYRHPIGRLVLNGGRAICLKRGGVPVAALRNAIACLKVGQVIGIFPEGGVKVGLESVLRGGSLRGGAAMIAIHGGTPIIPVVVLGTEKLNRVATWLPWRRGSRVRQLRRGAAPPSDTKPESGKASVDRATPPLVRQALSRVARRVGIAR